MKTNTVLATIAEAAATCTEAGVSASWYLFGSMLSDPDAANDIDMLVVYEHPDDAVQIRCALRSLCTALPLHLLLMSWGEEQETKFVESERCRLLFPPLANA